MQLNIRCWRLSLLLLFFMISCGQEQAPLQLPPPESPVYTVDLTDFPVIEEFVGQTYGASDIDIRARVEGFLEAIHFQEGSQVKKGQLLYSIDPQPFEAKVAEAQSRVAEARTMLVRAESELNRIRPLAEIDAVSQSDLDAAVAQAGAAQASLEAAEAQMRLTRIELGYTRIYAPINGIIGKTEARVGDFVGRGLNAVVLTTISDTDPILVRFSITEAEYLQINRYQENRRRQEIQEKYPELAGVELLLADGSLHPHRGKIDFADRQIDPTTGTLLIQASFPNPAGIVRPGQFARVRGVVDMLNGTIRIPQRSVKELQGTFQVYVVNDSSKVEIRPIETGPRSGNMWVVTKGLSAGERIVVEGLQKIEPGQKVKPVPSDFEVID